MPDLYTEIGLSVDISELEIEATHRYEIEPSEAWGQRTTERVLYIDIDRVLYQGMEVDSYNTRDIEDEYRSRHNL